MIDQFAVDKINVCEEFFFVDDAPIRRFSYIFDVDNTIIMNRIISKNDAIDFIRTKCGIKRNDFSSLSVSLDALNITSIEDFVGKKIFHTDDVRYCGWFFQFDPTPFANWYHECYYYFIMNKACYYEVQSMCGICDSISMQSV